ncbi:MAG: SDR family NAD(P)-dependent oxidoreductase [Clostridiales bacterium]|nr:SDR family NAD(P)-dependent oxidoreductase [Clostridiales bacterium]
MGNYLVTGACGGMGTAICRMLAENHHRVWGIDRSPDARSEAQGITVLSADLTDPDALRSAAERIGQEAGSLDGIVHAAGIYDLNSLVEMPEEDFVRDFDVNLFAVFRVNRLFVPLLEPGGRIVMISSELAPLRPMPFTGIYAVTKTAVEQYAMALRMELQLLGHRVIVIRPGAVKTNMLPASTANLDRFCEQTALYRCNADRFRRIVNRVEARHVPPERIARTVKEALTAKRPKLTYCVNRNPLLLLYGALPARVQLWAINKILEE